MIRTRLTAVSLCSVLFACATTGAEQSATPEPSPPLAASGRVDRAQLEAFVKSNGGLRECYQEELSRNAAARGRVLVRFTIQRSGAVARVAVLKSELSSRMIDCVTRSVSGWQTPFRPPSASVIDYPLVFTPG